MDDIQGNFQTLFAESSLPTFVYDCETLGFITVNDAAAAAYGYSHDEFRRMRITDIYPIDDAAKLLDEVERQRRGERITGVRQHRTKDGRIMDVETAAHMIEVLGRQSVVVIARDVTRRRRAELALREAYEREHEAAERLRTLDEMKNGFLQAVSHELRTPLASVLGYALTLERAGDTLDPCERADMVTRMAAGARKLERLLGDLLDLDRLVRGVLEPKRYRTDIGELARRTLSDVAAGDHPVTIEVIPVTAKVDAGKVERIIENLVANAVKHTPAGTPIIVNVGPYEHGALICVEDEGRGVPDELKSAIFEPFRQAPGTGSHGPGTGIGLSLVARFAELHGGRAWVEDRPAGGSRFCAYVPSSVREQVATRVPGSD